jgi:membrane protein YdbS with pleckstrin-like domain
MVQSAYMRKVIIFILLIVSFAISRLLFFLVNDPEGPNLLIVTVLAMLIFVPLFLIYLKTSRIK